MDQHGKNSGGKAAPERRDLPDREFYAWEDRARKRLKLSALEIGAVSRCNLSCAGCSRWSPAARPETADPGTVYRALAGLRTAASCTFLRVSGGEPLLHPDLNGLLKAIRRSGIARAVQLLTNGTLLQKRPLDWVEHVDMVQVSLYPGVTVSAAALEKLKRLCARKGKGLEIRKYRAFRLFQPEVPLPAPAVREVFETCQSAHAWDCHPVRKGRVHLCSTSLALGGSAADSCPIRPLKGLKERLAAFLYRRKPLSVCRGCLGTVGSLLPHRQVPAARWAEATRRGSIDRAHLARVAADPWLEESRLYSSPVFLRRKGGTSGRNEGYADWKNFFAAKKDRGS